MEENYSIKADSNVINSLIIAIKILLTTKKTPSI
jgi:hypothetical protein